MGKWVVEEQKSPIGEMRINIEEQKIYMQYRNDSERAAMYESAKPWLQSSEAERSAQTKSPASAPTPTGHVPLMPTTTIKG